jgi:heat-inducible transcriptional repressor
MPNQPLSEREEQILQAVVQLYTTTAEPVGSRAIVKQFSLGISPATVRNVMSDLEEYGYIRQVHTSSGRIPTDIGYRYYVDYLMKVQEVTHKERQQIEANFTTQLGDADEILKQTSKLLALISHQTGLVEAPVPSVAKIRHIELLPVDSKRTILMIADNYGRVRTLIVALPEIMHADDSRVLSNFLNKHLTNTPLDQMQMALESQLQLFVDEQRQLAEKALKVLDGLTSQNSDQLFLDGATQLFEQPEFQDMERAREVFGLLEEKDKITELMHVGTVSDLSHKSRVIIGAEAENQGFKEISVVSAPYKIDEETVGMIGVLGPRRMPYSRLSGLVEYTADKLGRLLSKVI